MIETEKLLKSILVQIKSANTYEDAVNIIENLCEKDWIAEADKRAEKMKSNQNKEAK